MQRFCPRAERLLGVVSILTRAFARVQHCGLRQFLLCRKFQSSLELSPECNAKGQATACPAVSFNPHSSFRPSATMGQHHWCIHLGVSILTRAFARVQHHHLTLIDRKRVSILTRAFARVQLFAFALGEPLSAFQSSLELSPECNGPGQKEENMYTIVSILTRAFARVQHGQQKPSSKQYAVSILTRAFARVQRCYRLLLGRRAWFQSSLELSPECNAKGTPSWPTTMRGFNPHSSFRPSATGEDGRGRGIDCGFNPHSSFRPSATGAWRKHE